MKSIAYWTPVDEPDKSNTLFYILYHPSREAAAANWKSFRDDPDWKSVQEKSEANGKLVISRLHLPGPDRLLPQLELSQFEEVLRLPANSN